MSGNFALELAAAVEKQPEVLTLVVKKIAFEVHNRVTQKTPVDTGRARANWQIAVGRMPRGTVAGIDKAVLGSLPGSATTMMAFSTLSTYNAMRGEAIFIVNNLSYINALEHGHSDQAPQGMVSQTIAEFDGIVSEVVGGL